ncbi:response regulator [Gaetbulibacter sp. M240]|uniref:response regulator n=1 Tax=Gaetbulibacter sp. M240 TaxID=3126511 RepID=UPI00374E504D
MVYILLGLCVVQILVLQYFFKNQIKHDLIRKNLEKRLDVVNHKLEEAQNTADHKSAYLANMSYEIRTPLSTVLGMLNMLKQTELSSDQLAQVEIADYSSKHLLQLVNMITDNADMESGEVTLKMSTMDLKSDLSRLFKVFEYQAWENGLDFEYKFLSKHKKKYSLLGDSARIQQVLINLINNAIKFTNSGKISIIVDDTVGLEEDQIVSFYIKDTGIGMGPEVMQSVLNHSEQINPLFKDYRGGGLGLSISYNLIKLMGGELKVESKENEGSTFYFSLQLKKTLNIKEEVNQTQPFLEEKINVLVAEDNLTNQKVIQFLLEQLGANCTFARNGLQAVRHYENKDFDIIFMDIYMPDMNGYMATQAIKETAKYIKRNTPIVAVSASAFEEDIVNAKAAGIDDFIAKPIDVNRLKELLEKYAPKTSITR